MGIQLFKKVATPTAREALKIVVKHRLAGPEQSVKHTVAELQKPSVALNMLVHDSARTAVSRIQLHWRAAELESDPEGVEVTEAVNHFLQGGVAAMQSLPPVMQALGNCIEKGVDRLFREVSIEEVIRISEPTHLPFSGAGMAKVWGTVDQRDDGAVARATDILMRVVKAHPVLLGEPTVRETLNSMLQHRAAVRQCYDYFYERVGWGWSAWREKDVAKHIKTLQIVHDVCPEHFTADFLTLMLHNVAASRGLLYYHRGGQERFRVWEERGDVARIFPYVTKLLKSYLPRAAAADQAVIPIRPGTLAILRQQWWYGYDRAHFHCQDLCDLLEQKISALWSAEQWQALVAAAEAESPAAKTG